MIFSTEIPAFSRTHVYLSICRTATLPLRFACRWKEEKGEEEKEEEEEEVQKEEAPNGRTLREGKTAKEGLCQGARWR